MQSSNTEGNMNAPAARKRSERAILELTALYAQYGYREFRMSKFEEYDFYAEYRSFLQAENILTFHDPSGKLLALKPDITLSIVRSVKEGSPLPQRLCYSETVYRAAGGMRSFREIPQVGLEYIGEIGLYAMCEVLSLALDSLSALSPSFIMDVSHVGLAGGLLAETGLPAHTQAELSSRIRAKNAHELTALCAANGVDAALAEKLKRLSGLYGPSEEVLKEVRTLDVNQTTHAAIAELSALCGALAHAGCGGVNLDFSLLNDLSYYNGVIFQGFLPELHACVLSGGRYDSLLRRMHKPGGAIGFAVNVGLLDSLGAPNAAYDADVLLLCGADADAPEALRRARELAAAGKRVTVRAAEDGAVRARETLRIGAEENK